MNQSSKDNLIGFSIGAILFLSIFCLFIFIGTSHQSGINPQRHESYRTWIKQTGNPKDLAFDEFVALSRTGFLTPSNPSTP